MLHTPDNSKGKILVDVRGHQIELVKSFDDETEEAEIYLRCKDGNYNPTSVVMVPSDKPNEYEMLSIKVKIPGAKIVDKKNRS